MAEEMAEVREEAAEVTSQRDAAEDEAQHLTTELERLQAQFDDDSAALQVPFLFPSVLNLGCYDITIHCIAFIVFPARSSVHVLMTSSWSWSSSLGHSSMVLGQLYMSHAHLLEEVGLHGFPSVS